MNSALQRANRRADRRAARLGAVEIEMEAPLDFEQTFFQEVNDSDIKMVSSCGNGKFGMKN